jgi:hypothetical protein
MAVIGRVLADVANEVVVVVDGVIVVVVGGDKHRNRKIGEKIGGMNQQ